MFGTFNFQMQPYCNVVTMTITPIPTGFTLDGFDDQCAALKRGSLTSAVGDAPRTAAVEPSDATLTTTDTVVAQVTISAPANGRILANASGYCHTTDGAVLDTARCSLTTGTAFDINRMAYLREFSAATLYGTPFALTRAFSVTAGAATTVRLVCNVFSGSARARSLSVTALFVAQ